MAFAEVRFWLGTAHMAQVAVWGICGEEMPPVVRRSGQVTFVFVIVVMFAMVVARVKR